MSVLVVIVAANSLLFIMYEHAGIHDPLVPEYSGAGIAFSLLSLSWLLNRYLSRLLAPCRSRAILQLLSALYARDGAEATRVSGCN